LPIGERIFENGPIFDMYDRNLGAQFLLGHCVNRLHVCIKCVLIRIQYHLSYPVYAHDVGLLMTLFSPNFRMSSAKWL